MTASAARPAAALLLCCACGSLDQARATFCMQRPGVCDASVPDAGGADAGFDAGVPDSGAPDAGMDAGVPDAGPVCPFVLDAGPGSISGTVTDLHTGNTMSGADIWWSASAGAMCNAGTNCVMSDSMGHYTLTGVAAGCVVLSGKSNGYLLRSFDVRVDAGASVMFDVGLSTSGIMSGTVRWPDGGPVSGAVIRADGGQVYTETSMVADGTGHYASNYIAIGPYTATATAPDGGSASTGTVLVVTAPATSQLDFTLDAG